VSFRWKDYRHRNQLRVMTLDATEFIRRFLLHVLPKGFVRIRHFGFLANCVREKSLALARALLVPSTSTPAGEDVTAAGAAWHTNSDDESAHLCPACRQGRMRFVRMLKPFDPLESPTACQRFDSS